MSRKIYVLALPSEPAPVLSDLSSILPAGDEVYLIDNCLAFVATELNLRTLTDRLESTPIGRRQFFLVDISDSDRGGRMHPKFWEFLRQSEKAAVAAE